MLFHVPEYGYPRFPEFDSGTVSGTIRISVRLIVASTDGYSLYAALTDQPLKYVLQTSPSKATESTSLRSAVSFRSDSAKASQ